MTATRALGPWSLGIDRVHAPDEEVFQPPERGAPPARLTQAVNVDLTDAGWPQTRPGTALAHPLPGAHTAWSVGGRLLVQAGAALYAPLEESGATPLWSGLRRRLVIAEHAGNVFASDGTHHRVLTASGLATWGLPVPDLTVTPIPGHLSAGTYLVQASWVDDAGNEGGVSDLTSITLTANQSMQITVPPVREAAALRLYASPADGRHTSFVADLIANAGRHVLHDVQTTDAAPPVTEQMRGPISNAAGIASFRAFVILWRDNFAIRSEAAEPHLFHPDSIMQFPGSVAACVGLDAGLWIATAAGLYWVTGEGPDGWIPKRAGLAACYAGAATLPGAKIAAAQTGDPVAVFVAADGLIVGRPDGSVVPLTDGRYVWPAGSRVSFAYAERANLRQLLIATE